MTLRSQEKTLRIREWNVGFQKVKFTLMLQRELGLSLSRAKDMTDRVLANELVELPIIGVDPERITSAVIELGAIITVEELEDVCQ